MNPSILIASQSTQNRKQTFGLLNRKWILNFRLNIMDSENGIKLYKSHASSLLPEPTSENPPPLSTPSPELNSCQKSPYQLMGRTSQQILSQIYSLLEERPPLQRKDSIKSLKSLDKKDSNNNNINFKCKCKKTKCLKMYCECFALGRVCFGCNCSDCQNLLQFEEERANAIDQALQRDPDIFQPVTTGKRGGCICKKTECLKKYCECYSSGVACTSQCKCQNCANTG